MWPIFANSISNCLMRYKQILSGFSDENALNFAHLPMKFHNRGHTNCRNIKKLHKYTPLEFWVVGKNLTAAYVTTTKSFCFVQGSLHLEKENLENFFPPYKKLLQSSFRVFFLKLLPNLEKAFTYNSPWLIFV